MSNELPVLRRHDLLNSNPSAKHEVPAKLLLVVEETETPNPKKSVIIVLHSLKGLELGPVAEDTTYVLLQELKESTQSNWNSHAISYMLARFHSTRTWYKSTCGEKPSIEFIPGMEPECSNTDLEGKSCSLVQ